MRPLDAVATVEPDASAVELAARYNQRYAGLSAHDVIALSVEELFPGRVAMVSSFGAESVVLLHLLSEIDPTVPVLFLDTGRLFPETLEYRTTVTNRLGLRDVRTITPDAERLAALDPVRALWMTNPDLCCRIRKTEPLAKAVKGFDAWFTGRKRFQTAGRSSLPLFEADGTRIKINPLAEWSSSDLLAYAEDHELPAHPLVAKGYPSIGCVPCTDRVLPGEDQRAGRWRGTGKVECGIHIDLESDGSGI
ncbi:MAG: phosphoadenylyl-sulfate reductase [Bauldia sp.]